MIRIFRRFAVLSLISILGCTISVKAAESQSGGSSADVAASATAFTVPADASKGAAADENGARLSKMAVNNPKPDLRVALCGVEADAGNANLDAGLVDFNVPNSAHGNTTWSEGPRDAGRNVHDYPSPVFIGVTLGYHF